MCLGNVLKEVALCSMLSKLQQMNFHHILWIIIDYHAEYWLNSLEYWKWKTSIYIPLLDDWLDINLGRDIIKRRHYFRIM